MEHMTLSFMSKKEKSLLLFLETRAVDYGGLVDTQFMNSDDHDIAKKWNSTGFVRFGRLTRDSISNREVTHWCELSEKAWELAHAARRARFARLNGERRWVKTEEKRFHTDQLI